MSNDYLALGRHPAVVRAQVEALLQHGNGLMMSGVMVGDTDPLRGLERRLAAFLDAPAVVLCQSGWAASAVFSSTLLPPDVAGLGAVLHLVLTGEAGRERLARNARETRAGLTELGCNISPSESQIISLRPGSGDSLSRLAAALDAHGVFGAPFAHPATAPGNTAPRLSVHSELTQDDLARILRACAAIRDKVGLATAGPRS